MLAEGQPEPEYEMDLMLGIVFISGLGSFAWAWEKVGRVERRKVRDKEDRRVVVCSNMMMVWKNRIDGLSMFLLKVCT